MFIPSERDPSKQARIGSPVRCCVAGNSKILSPREARALLELAEAL